MKFIIVAVQFSEAATNFCPALRQRLLFFDEIRGRIGARLNKPEVAVGQELKLRRCG